MFQYLSRKLFSYSKLLASVFKTVEKLQDIDKFVACLENITMICKQLSSKTGFINHFTSHILVNLISCGCSLESAQSESVVVINSQILRCVEKVVFPNFNSKGASDFLYSLYEINSSKVVLNSIFTNLFSTLSNSYQDLDEYVKVKLLVTVFKCFSSSVKHESEQVYRFFAVMCLITGIDIQTNESENGKSVLFTTNRVHSFLSLSGMKTANNTSLIIIRDILTFFQNVNIDLQCEINEITFQKWLQLLSLDIINNYHAGISFQILSVVINLDPLSLETLITDILKVSAFRKKDCEDIFEQYSHFLNSILNMFGKLHRLPKLFSILCSIFYDHVTSYDSTDVEVLEILPESFYSEFRKILLTLPLAQILSLANILEEFLSNQCLPLLSASKLSKNSLLLIELVSELFHHFLCNVTIADHSTPSTFLQKFLNFMDNFKNTLQSFGQCLLNKKHNPTLIVSYLRMCFAWGEMRLLLWKYHPLCDPDIFEAMVDDPDATNLTCLHSYLTVEEWKLIAQRISNFGAEACQQILIKLVLQKLQLLQAFVSESKIGNKQACAIEYILNHLAENWSLLINEYGTSFLPLLSPVQIDKVAKLIVPLIRKEENLLNTFARDDIHENRMLMEKICMEAVKSLCQYFVEKITKKDSVSQLKCLRSFLINDILCYFDNCNLTLSESSFDDFDKCLHKVGLMVKEACIEQTKSASLIPKGRKFQELTSYLRILSALPLSCLSEHLQVFVFIILFALLINIDAIYLDVKENQSELAKITASNIIVLLEGRNMSSIIEYLHMGDLINWLKDQSVLTDSDTSTLCQIIFEVCIKYKGFLEQLSTGVELVNENRTKKTLSARSLNLAVSLLKILSQVDNRHYSSEEKSLWKKYRKALSSGIMKYMRNNKDSLHSTGIFVEGIDVSLRSLLHTPDADLSEALPFLSTLIKAILLDPDNKTVEMSVKFNFLATVLKSRKQLSATLPNNIIQSVWEMVMDNFTEESACKDVPVILEAATEDEYSWIMKKLVDCTAQIQKTGNDKQLNIIIHLWKATLHTCKLRTTEMQCKFAALQEACQHLIYIVLAYKEIPKHSVLEFLNDLIKELKNMQHNRILDLCFETINATDIESDSDIVTSVAMLNSSVSILMELVLYHFPLIQDRIPSFLQSYRYILSCISALSDVEKKREESHIHMLADCAFNIEKLTNCIAQQKKDFTPVAPYVIADTLKLFQTYLVHPSVKIHMLNTVYSLLNLCDYYGIQFMTSAMSLQQQEIFKVVYHNFNKFHKFKGKV